MENPIFSAERQVDPEGSIAIYRTHGPLNGRDTCFEWLETVRKDIQSGQKRVVVNLEGTPKVDSTGLGILASVHVSATNAGGKLCLTGLNKSLRVLFDTTWLLRVIPHAEDEESAVRTAAS